MLQFARKDPHKVRSTSLSTCTCCGKAPYGWGPRFAGFLVCAQVEIIALGEPLPKCDIVDTSFHASAETRQIGASQSAFPTT